MNKSMHRIKDEYAVFSVVHRYADYEEYKKHQMEKAQNAPFMQYVYHTYAPQLRRYLQLRFLEIEYVLNKRIDSILCLGSRQGTEVLALKEFTNDVLGVDLYPIGDYPVITSDFHDIPIQDRKFDMVYSNSIDHVCFMGRFLSEIHRLLNDDGIVVLDVAPGMKEPGHKTSEYETIFWDTIDDITQLVASYSNLFTLRERLTRDCGLQWQSLIFKKAENV